MRWRFYAGIGSVFALGGVAGGLLGVTAERDRIRNFEKEGPVPALESLAERLEDELKLDPDQSRHIREVFASARPQLLEMERDRRVKMRELMDRTTPPIMEVLNPAQKQRYQELQEKLQIRLRLREQGEAISESPR